MTDKIDDFVASGDAWNQFCDDLKAAGALLHEDGNPRDAFSQAEGMRYLTRLLRMGLENFLEYRDPLFPELRRSAHETIKLGGDNPDNHYSNAAINGAYDYKITGTRGTVHYLGFGTQAGNYGKDGTLQPTGYIEAKDIALNDDGTFEVIVSKDPHEGNWLPMREDSGMLLVRQTFGDRTKEKPAELKVTRIGQEGEAPVPLSPQKLVHGLTAATRYVTGSVKIFLEWSKEFASYEPNTFKMLDHKRAQRVGGDPNIRYFYGMWDFADDEALEITTPIPDCDYWNIQLNNYWMESLDYRYHPISVNHKTAKLNDDGSVTIYVAHQQIDKPNWLTTAGHDSGVLMWRWIGDGGSGKGVDQTPPKVRKIKLSDVKD